jgi:hypothetical protein
MTLSVPVQAQGGQSILIRNAVLINREGGPDQVAVNILIKDSKLEILSEDFIPLSEADVSYDAKGGTILGELTAGHTGYTANTCGLNSIIPRAVIPR